jgi:G:T-mismatch repair DNA endonuclease (very short patch repair protein)/uncharacterized protein YdaU (DUF1376 family)
MEGEVYIPTDEEVLEVVTMGSEEWKKKISERLKDFYKGPNGNITKKKIGMKLKGRVRSEIVRQKISIGHKGRKVSEDVRLRTSMKLKGKCYRTEDGARRMRESKIGKKQTEEDRKKKSEALKKYYQTPEGKEKIIKIGLIHKGKIVSPETIRKMRESKSRYKQSKPEKAVRDELTRLNIPHSEHPRGVKNLELGKFKGHCFDIVIDFKKIIIEIQGCAVHGCSLCFPSPNKWQLKNRVRDQVLREAIQEAIKNQSEWKLVELWTHDIDSDMTIEYLLRKEIPELFDGEIK